MAILLPATVSQCAQLDGEAAAREAARQILEIAGLKGGLVVHVGCGEGRLTAALRANDSYVVHGLDASTDQIGRARAHLQKLGLCGPVSVERYTGQRMPYADNLANLVVVEDGGLATRDEFMRILASGGVLLVAKAGQWDKTIKPRPREIDEWSHYQHDASGNPVSHDEVVGPPGRLQWTAGPLYMRSHEHIPGLYALVTSGGRIFYILDEAPISSIRATPRWRLVARDAFNGVELWKKPVGDWFPHIVNWGATPPQLQRRLVAVGDRVYATLGLHAPVSVLEAATGKLLDTYQETVGTEEILVHQGVLLLSIREVTAERKAELADWQRMLATNDSPAFVRETAEPFVKGLRSIEAKGEKTILALDSASGRQLWKVTGAEVRGLRTGSLSASSDRVFYQEGDAVVCRQLKSGKILWSASAPPLRVVSGDSVLCASGKEVVALSAEIGQIRWQRPTLVTEVRDVFVASGSVWVGGFKPIEGKRGPVWGPYFVTQRDPATGSVIRHIEPENPGHHHRCYDNKATDRYILGGRRGTEFIDLSSGEVLWNSWARGVCRYGVMPGNGLLYVPPHACGCYVAAKLTGFNALAPRGASAPVESPKTASERLDKGPAFAAEEPAAAKIGSPADWPTYRGDAGRSGRTQSAVPATLRLQWKTRIGDSLSAPTVSGGKVFIASSDDHRLIALDAATGRLAWDYTAGARVDSPPTLFQGMALFGCRDGRVYGVRMADGALAWRLQVAAEDRRVIADGQVESVSPAHGSVLLHDGALYVTSGRSSYLDGGIDLYSLEPRTGRIRSKTAVYSPDPETGKQPPHSAPAFMPGARTDILSGAGDQVYLRDLVFDRQGNALKEGDPHLFALTGFLDNAWAHRSYFIFGRECSLATGCSGRDKRLIYGRLLVFDGQTVCGYGRGTVHWSNQLQDGPYRLFATDIGEASPRWTKSLPIQARAMVWAGEILFVAGPPVAGNEWLGINEEKQEALLMALAAADGRELARHSLDGMPLFDGMAAADGKLYVALENGSLVCLGE